MGVVRVPVPPAPAAASEPRVRIVLRSSGRRRERPRQADLPSTPLRSARAECHQLSNEALKNNVVLTSFLKGSCIFFSYFVRDPFIATIQNYLPVDSS